MDQLPKIVQRHLQTAAKPGAHPDPDLLNAFVEKSLTDRERSQILLHLADCANCREVVTLAMPEIESTPSPSTDRSLWLSWPVLRWGALVACVVVVSAAVTLHYQQRQTGESSVAEKIPATLPAEKASQLSTREKLAAKIPPPAPFPSDRDSGSADKLAKQQGKKIDAGEIAARTGVSAPHRLDENERDQKLYNNQLADSAVQAADKPTPSAGMMIAAAPATVPSTKVAQAAPHSEIRNGTAASASGAVTESVTVESADTSVLETVQTPERKAKDEATKNEPRKEAQAARSGAVGAGLGGRKTDSLSAHAAETVSGNYAKRSRAYSAPRWTLSADGVLQRSLDSGKTWQAIPVASGVVFRALAANDSDIWAGGAAGTLYHSSDAGQNWVRVEPVVEGQSLTSDVLTVEFGDTQHGKLTTSARETWITSDAGATWQKR
jgi:hypothetical protein